MKLVTKFEWELLKKEGLIKDKNNFDNPNFTIASKRHGKSYYITEEPEIVEFLKQINNF